MKLIIRRGGGFAGMITHTELDAKALPGPAAADFAGAVARAELNKTDKAPSARGAARERPWPDAMLYEISLEASGPPVNAQFTDQTLPEGVRHLLEWVDGRPERVESIEQ